MNYFDLMGKLGAEFLHPGGKASTELLLNELESFAGKNILEVGCGTGATAVCLSKRVKPILTATDVSSDMLRASKQRVFINFGFHKITFVKIDGNGKLPFDSETFDAVYSESVIALLEENRIPLLVNEIYRVLKPNGKLICNDAIWNSNASREEIKRLTDLGKRDFGYAVCSSNPAYLQEWKALYTQAGFGVVKILPLDNFTLAGHYRKRSLYTYYRKFISLFSPAIHQQKLFFEQRENTHHLSAVKALDAYIFVLEKKSS